MTCWNPIPGSDVNLGYGSITEGWNQGPANVPTTFGLFPDINQTQLSDALSNGWQQGVTDALNDLQHPVSYQDQVAPLLPFADALYTIGVAPENPSFTDVIDGLLKLRRLPGFRRDAKLVADRHRQ